MNPTTDNKYLNLVNQAHQSIDEIGRKIDIMININPQKGISDAVPAESIQGSVLEKELKTLVNRLSELSRNLN